MSNNDPVEAAIAEAVEAAASQYPTLEAIPVRSVLFPADEGWEYPNFPYDKSGFSSALQALITIVGDVVTNQLWIKPIPPNPIGSMDNYQAPTEFNPDEVWKPCPVPTFELTRVELTPNGVRAQYMPRAARLGYTTIGSTRPTVRIDARTARYFPKHPSVDFTWRMGSSAVRGNSTALRSKPMRTRLGLLMKPPAHVRAEISGAFAGLPPEGESRNFRRPRVP